MGGFLLQITLKNGAVIQIDEEDYAIVEKHRWYTTKSGSRKKTYACTKINGQKVLIHRIILSAESGQVVDHINGDGMDNRKVNLRLCTHTQNLWNQKKNKNNRSGYKGVFYSQHHGRWAAEINADRTRHFLGYFEVIEDAARAYNEAAIKYHGHFAELNRIGEAASGKHLSDISGDGWRMKPGSPAQSAN